MNTDLLYPCPRCHRVVYSLPDCTLYQDGRITVRLSCGHAIDRPRELEQLELLEDSPCP